MFPTSGENVRAPVFLLNATPGFLVIRDQSIACHRKVLNGTVTSSTFQMITPASTLYSFWLIGTNGFWQISDLNVGDCRLLKTVIYHLYRGIFLWWFEFYSSLPSLSTSSNPSLCWPSSVPVSDDVTCTRSRLRSVTNRPSKIHLSIQVHTLQTAIRTTWTGNTSSWLGKTFGVLESLELD